MARRLVGRKFESGLAFGQHHDKSLHRRVVLCLAVGYFIPQNGPLFLLKNI
ncbi:hypothetical protein FOCG_06447 [Fusarium oxysporum f. sp. radicis-lycopersici 26381]|jgi:hypothetical protein|uniref:Uncharacterized protein n=2 Tax=Fusarium oxysporum TaxID=5507 RepID=W9J9P7_FUSOX|nr:hypothetical protein FOYG_01179 [Fusarium oxysporum NRRL 32931]EWZ47632.1 hypothetical protein FOZG_03507 [Fusarium oxysporum Fo47]EWZ92683.1 hypothetical protein FOWG_05747 [Fusarium oxysporum f. sp. lycopersici MN25]EXL52961.1 hypothetical protein FOCG_06447 [Fusarium oxysporum f. sp. radicis-lycopersici 26381]